ncbi:MAG: hypothetical protein AAFO69_08910 [Bacteroidota bacterium]
MIKKIGIALLVIIVGFAVTLWVISEPRPEGKPGPEADMLARKMLKALNEPAYDSAKVLKWSFKGLHQYSWNKANDRVEVVWDDLKVDLDLKTESGVVYQNGTQKNNEGEVAKALMYFYNDSFWLVAPYKLFDDGVQRSIVNTEEGDALLVRYTTGGATPGDSYLWFLDEKGFPVKYKMWVSIIPVGGLEFTWEGWQQYQGVWLPGTHKGLIEVEMLNVEVVM